MYCVPATTVVVGVRVRVPALFHAAVELKTAVPVGVTVRGCVDVVVPVRPLRTTVVFVTMFKDAMQVVKIGTELDNVTVIEFTAQG